jgi:hypothetical protein
MKGVKAYREKKPIVPAVSVTAPDQRAGLAV